MPHGLNKKLRILEDIVVKKFHYFKIYYFKFNIYLNK